MRFSSRSPAWSLRRPPAGSGQHVVDGDLVIESGSATALGDRSENQDRCAVSSRWLVLSDGAGGHTGGALAAELTVEAVLARLEGGGPTISAGALGTAVSEANRAVRSIRKLDAAVVNMAATLTVAVVSSVSATASDWLVVNVGDSRAWLVTPDLAMQITEDDNVAGQLVRAGALTPAEALVHPGRNWITRAIGPEDRIESPATTAHLRAGDALIVASDGLDVLESDDIRQAIADASTAADAAQRLVDLAIRKGASDNVTAAVARHMPSSRHEGAA